MVRQGSKQHYHGSKKADQAEDLGVNDPLALDRLARRKGLARHEAILCAGARQLPNRRAAPSLDKVMATRMMAPMIILKA